MAVKNTMTKTYHVDFAEICTVLRHADYSTCLGATFLEEAILPDGVEFRYVTKTTLWKYGRNYFIKVKQENGGTASVAITTQSRKVTVLVDTAWKESVDKAFSCFEILLRR